MWAQARRDMLLDPAVAFLNAGSAGPLSRSVHERVSGLRRRLAAEPLDFLLREAPDLLWRARERLAEFVGGNPRQLALSTNVTTAVNALASGLDLEAPGEILLTDHEYPPMRWCWERAAKRLGLGVKTVRLPRLPGEPGEIVETVAAALGPRTRVFFFSHVLSPTGTVLPAKQLCDVARARGVLTVIDGAHGPGFTRLNLGDMDCDYYIGSGHKWLLAPTGTGFIHFGPGMADRLEPVHVSWGYVSLPGDEPAEGAVGHGRPPSLRRLEIEGTRDICPWLALPEAIDFRVALGEQAGERMRELASYALQCLAGSVGLEPATPEHRELRGAMVAFALPEATRPALLRRRLWDGYRIEVSVTELAGRALLRASTHFFNTEDEIGRLTEALNELTRSNCI